VPRIYSIAKDLNYESKDLLDAIRKAGITGKTSPLASLEDDEYDKLKAFLKDQGKAEAPAAAPAAPRIDAPIRSAARNQERPIPVVYSSRPSSPGSVKPLAAGLERSSTSDRAPVSVRAEAAPKFASLPRGSSLDEQIEAAVQVAREVERWRNGDGAPAESPAAEREEESNVATLEAEKSPEAIATAPEVEATAPPAGEVESAEDDADGSAPAEAEAAPAPEAERPRDAGGMRRVAPLGRDRGMRVIGPIGRRNNKPGGDEPAAGEPKTDKPAPEKPARKVPPRPAINFAPMPTAKLPPGPKEEKAQKPELAFTPDAMRVAKESGKLHKLEPGQRAPLGDFTKGGKKSPGAAGAPGAPGSGAPAGGFRGRRPVAFIGGAEEQKEKPRPKRRGRGDEDGGYSRPRIGTRSRGKTTDTSAPRKQAAVLELPATVRSFSEAAGVPAGRILKYMLVEQQKMANINSLLSDEEVELLLMQFGADLDVRRPEDAEDFATAALEGEDDDPADLVERPPVITFLGHVDHGKTSLLDRIIGLNVVKGEAGGITQHIRAYRIENDGRPIAFVDTPGHEAFTEMRARGANVTDIAVLVVAADDGIMPQTEEAIAHAKAAGVPIVVALNKIDLPGVDEQKTFQGLAQHELLPSAWGGDVEVVKTSAHTGEGLEELLETLLTIAEINEYKANPERQAVGVCLEAEQEPGRGVIAKMMVKNGTLRVGDVIVCGASYGRVKAMYDTLKPMRRLLQAGPSTPVNITGLETVPGAGDKFVILDDIAKAREIAQQREARTKSTQLSGFTQKVSLEEFQRRLASGDLADKTKDVVTLNLIIRADVRGSIEAILKELSKLEHPEVAVKVLQAAVGGITVGDVALAEASDAIIAGFNVVPDENARSMAEERGVEIRRYDIIYKLTDDVRAVLEGRLKPEKREVELGTVLVQKVFSVSRYGNVAGCRILRGTVERNSRIRLIRDQRILGEYGIDSLRREKDDVAEVRQGMECGIKLQNYNDIKEGDVLEAFKIEEVARTL
jgi:translation initiation factor IF-2